MKSFHLFLIGLGMVLGIILSNVAFPVRQAFAQADATALTAEEVDKKLDEILESQKGLKKKLEDIKVQTQFLKASSTK